MVAPEPKLEHSLSTLPLTDILLLAIGAMGIGFSKAGFPGVSMLHVVVFALVFGPIESTGILLPMLIVGDICAIGLFGRKANWTQIRCLLPFTIVGIVFGYWLMERLDPDWFRWIVGGIIFSLSAAQARRMMLQRRVVDQPTAAQASDASDFESTEPSLPLALLLGPLAGVSTMLANAAGPIVALYLLAVSLPKFELIGTAAWLFFVLNVLKLPFSYELGLINLSTLKIDALLIPAIPFGLFLGRWLVSRISQSTFNVVLLGFTVLMAIRLILG